MRNKRNVSILSVVTLSYALPIIRFQIIVAEKSFYPSKNQSLPETSNQKIELLLQRFFEAKLNFDRQRNFQLYHSLIQKFI